MKVIIKRSINILGMCIGFIGHALYANTDTISFSFDQLYPTTTVSRALNSLRHVWSLAQDLNDNHYDADKARTVWLELYGATDQLIMQKEGTRLMADAMLPVSVPEDIIEYIKTVWQLIGRAYDEIEIQDVGLAQFIAHMRVASAQMIDKL